MLVWGATLRCLTNYSASVTGKDFEQVVFAVLLRKEKPGPVGPEFPRPDQSLDGAVSLGHVQPGWLVIFIRRHTIQAKRDESSYEVSVRMLHCSACKPKLNRACSIDRATHRRDLRSQDRVFVIYERHIIERSVVGVAKHNERYGSTVAVCVEIHAEHSSPSATCRQHRI